MIINGLDTYKTQKRGTHMSTPILFFVVLLTTYHVIYPSKYRG